MGTTQGPGTATPQTARHAPTAKLTGSPKKSAVARSEVPGEAAERWSARSRPCCALCRTPAVLGLLLAALGLLLTWRAFDRALCLPLHGYQPARRLSALLQVGLGDPRSRVGADFAAAANAEGPHRNHTTRRALGMPRQNHGRKLTTHWGHLPKRTQLPMPARGLQDPPTYNTKFVSSHICLGDSFSSHSCVFYNVLYDLKTREFYYGYDADGPPRAVDYLKQGVEEMSFYFGEYPYVSDQSYFPHHEVSSNTHDLHGFKVRKLGSETIAAESQEAASSIERAILFRTFGHSNFGHFLLDDLFSLFAALRNLDAFVPDTQVLVEHPSAHLTKFAALLGRPAIDWDYASKQWTDQGHRFVHFQSVVVGTLPYGTTNGMWHAESLPPHRSKTAEEYRAANDPHSRYYEGKKHSNNGVSPVEHRCDFGKNVNRAAQWRELRAVTARHIEVDPTHRPTQHQIVIIDKAGRRRIHNPEQLEAHLQTRFKGSSVKVLRVDPSTLSFKEQAVLMTQTTITISPRGAISFGCIYQPPGSFTIVPESLAPQRRIAEYEYFWRSLDYLTQLIYPVSRPSRDLDCHLAERHAEAYSALHPKMEDKNKEELYDECDVVVRPEVLDLLIDEAMYEMSLPRDKRGGAATWVEIPSPFGEFKTQFVSSHTCLGDSFVSRSCLLRNVFYDVSFKEFIYGYEREGPARLVDFPAAGVPDPLFNRGGFYVADDAYFPAAHKYEEYGYKIKKVDTEYMEQLSHNLASSIPRAVLFKNFGGDNLGNFFIDNLYPVYAALLNLDMLTTDTKLLVQEPSALHLPKFKELLGNEAVDWDYASRAWMEQGTQYVHFESVVVGLVPYGTTNAMWSVESRQQAGVKRPMPCDLGKASNRAAQWLELRALTMRNLGVKPDTLPRKHQIVVIDKKGRRALSRAREVRDHLVERFKDAAGKPTAEVLLVDYENWALKDLVALLAETTITISPRGGASIACLYQAPGTYMIVPESLDHEGRIVEYEEFWESLNHITQLIYPVSDRESDLDCRGLEQHRAARHHEESWDECDVILDPRKLDVIVDQALYEMALHRS